MYQRPEAPRSIGGTLDDGFRLFKACFSQIFILAFVAAVLGQIPSFMLSAGVDADNPLGQLTIGFGIALIVASLLAAVIYGAIIAKIDAMTKNQTLSVSQALAVGLQRFFPLVVCGVLYTIAVILGTVAFIIPGIILSITLLFGVYAVVTENMGPIAALKYSHNLVWGNWWRTAAVLLVGTFILMVGFILVGVLSGLGVAVGSGIDPESLQSNPILNFVIVPLFSALTTPLVYALIMAAYNDLKLRRSGADLVERIGAEG